MPGVSQAPSRTVAKPSADRVAAGSSIFDCRCFCLRRDGTCGLQRSSCAEGALIQERCVISGEGKLISGDGDVNPKVTASPIFNLFQTKRRRVQKVRCRPLSRRQHPVSKKQKEAPPRKCALFVVFGAEGETRTPTAVRQLDPEPSASTSSATSALQRSTLKKKKIDFVKNVAYIYGFGFDVKPNFQGETKIHEAHRRHREHIGSFS